MSEQNRDQGQPKESAQPAGSAPKPTSAEQPKSAWDNGAAGTVGSRKRQYLIGSRPLPGAAPMPTDLIVQALNTMPGVEIVRRLRPRGSQALSGSGNQPAFETIIVRMDEQQGEALRRSAAPNLVVEADEMLHCGGATPAGAMRFYPGEQMTPLPGPGKNIAFRVVGEEDRPVAGAHVIAYGTGLPSQAVTDASGQATVTFFDEHNGGPEAPCIARALYVRPAADHWERFIADPALGDGTNLIRLRPLKQSFPNFPAERLVGWGQRMMKLDQLADGLEGAGVKIGLIDSGCDNTHSLLRHVNQGVNVVEPGKPNGWTNDPIGHGTHCCGIITAGGATGVRGFAPGSELHVFKAFPGGRISTLIEAFDECIERQIDVVQIGVGSEWASELVTFKLAEALQNGVACIAAAGGSGGLVQFPAVAPGVLAVSAIGKFGEFPPDSYHAQMALGQPVGADGLFFPRFSGYAPEAAVCAPGVAIVSTVPGGGYAAWDGAAIAAAHVTGFAALLLAHYPLFRGAYVSRGEHRVAALFETIRASGDPSRIGGGLADLQRIPGWAFLAQQPVRGDALPRLPEAAAAGAGFLGALQQHAAPNHFLMQLRAMGMI